MNLTGTTLSFPLRPDVRGTLAAVSDRQMLIEQAIRDVIETRQGERVMLPDYGIPDFVFSVLDGGLKARLAYFIKEQVERYVPLVDTVTVQTGRLRDGAFAPGFESDGQRAVVSLTYIERGNVTAPRNLVFPVWQL